jgi:diguanylate cyclase (GGDEF)-like protein
MNSNDNEDDSDTDATSQSGVPNQLKGCLSATIEKNIACRESIVIDEEMAVLSREKLAHAREYAAHLRENTADMRENVADIREKTVTSREEAVNSREENAILSIGKASGYEPKTGVEETIPTMPGDQTNTQINMLRQANAHLVVSTIEAHNLTEQVKIAKDEMDYLAHHDTLTDLPNRLLLKDRISQAIELAHRHGGQLAVMFMDLDQFKYINDSLGHTVGDQLLQSVAQRLVVCMRHSDTISRHGGDEFILLLSDIAHVEDAAQSAQKILASIGQLHHIEQHDLHINVSIGISIYPDDGLDVETLIKNADTAMYCAKENGRNNYKFFKQDMNDLAVQRQSIEADLRNALDRRELMLYYQPKVNLLSGAIIGVEALIRWQHPKLGLVLPDQFISIAEDCGQILEIGRWVQHEACRQARIWQEADLPPITVAINASAIEFRENSFLENIRTTLKDTCLEAQYLELELTESLLMQNAESNNSALHALADMGIKLVIDDFGTGYSSLSYLRQFPIDSLKIDRSFVNQMTSNADDANIVSAVISLGKSLNKRVIAEGVETSEQCELLLAQHCDEGQGYYFGRPVAAEKITILLQTLASLTFPH